MPDPAEIAIVGGGGPGHQPPHVQPVRPEGEPGPVQRDRASTFLAMTFNVGAGLAPADKVVEAIRAEVPDIVGLEELSKAHAERIEADLADLYPWRVLHPGQKYEGKGLLSRFEIHEEEQLHFAPGRPDLRAMVEVQGRHLHVLVAHPRPPKVGLQGVVFDRVTARQIDMLAEMASNGDPTLLLGDFNMHPRGAPYRRWHETGLIDAFKEAGARGATLPKRVGNTSRVHERLRQILLPPVLRVDYIWYSPHLRAEEAWVGPDGGSDHLPVLAMLHWRNGEG